MGALPRVGFLDESEQRARIPLEMSNFYCHPGKAGGSPMILGALSIVIAISQLLGID